MPNADGPFNPVPEELTSRPRFPLYGLRCVVEEWSKWPQQARQVPVSFMEVILHNEQPWDRRYITAVVSTGAALTSAYLAINSVNHSFVGKLIERLSVTLQH